VEQRRRHVLTIHLYPTRDKTYFVHVDLARKHDRCAVAMGHVVKWEKREIGKFTTEPAPVVKIDALRYWIPKKDKEVDFTDVREYILDLARKGFSIKPGHLRPVGVCRYA
jgi:hypothetical protein